MGSKKCILIVDDDESQSESLVLILQNNGYHVESSVTGEGALEIARNNQIDLVFIAITLPDSERINLIESFKQIDPNMAIIVATDFAPVENAIRTQKTGVSGYLKKPINIDEMFTNVQYLLEKQTLVHDKRQAEEALKMSEDKFHNLLETLQEGIWAIDENANTIFVNHHMADMLGYTIEEMKGKSLFYFMDERGKKIAEYNIDRRKSGIKECHEFEFLKKDGTRMYASLETGPITDDTGGYVGSIAGVVDITGRRRVEQELISAQERLNELHRLAQIGTFSYDTDTDTLTWSEELFHIAGRDPSLPSPPLQEMSRFFTPFSWKGLNQAFSQILNTKEPVDVELEMVHSDSSIRWVHAHIAGMFDSQGKLKGFLGTVHDDTEQKQSKMALYEANKKVRLLNSITRHDILNKLSSLLSLHDLVEESSDPDTIHLCKAQIEQLIHQIQSTIEFTREYEDFGILSSSWLQINPLIQSAQTFVSSGSVSIVNLIPDDLEIYADPIVKTVFITLIENGIRHGEKISEIKVFCFEDKNTLTIVVEDDGVGIPEEEKERIFEQGYGNHTGIGLFLAREILAITNLSIRESGVFGLGARFEIDIPAGKYHFLSGSKQIEESCPMFYKEDASSGSDTLIWNDPDLYTGSIEQDELPFSLLLIDDEQFLLDAVSHYLTNKCGFEISSRLNAKEAIQLLLEKKFDAIISDYDMPGMNGLELLKYLKSIGEDTPFIMLTGKGNEDIVIEALNSGADFYIQKGEEPGLVYQDLENKIRFAISQRRNEKKLKETTFILERKNRELENARNELAHLNMILEGRVIDRTKEVDSLIHHKNLYIEMIGHDLKTPLTPICALLPLILKNEQNSDTREILSILIKNATFMHNFIDKVLMLARLDPGLPSEEIHQIRVRETIDESISQVWYAIQERNIIIQNQVDKDLEISMNSLHLETMIRNILENAIKYSQPGGFITLSAMRDRNWICLMISDLGKGMSNEDREHIFDEFYQGDNSRHERTCHGLGLSIVKRIVDLYQGTIHVESQGAGKGSTFIIRFPKKLSK